MINKSFNHHALAVALAPSSSSNLSKFFNGVPELQKNLARLKPVFCTVFRENSIKLRKKFFAEELVQILWKNYVKAESNELSRYLTQLKTQDIDQKESQCLLKDIQDLSDQMGFQIIPTEILNS